MLQPSNAFTANARVAKNAREKCATKISKATKTNMARFTVCAPGFAKVSTARKRKRATCSTASGAHLAITLIDNLPLGLNLRLDRLRLRKRKRKIVWIGPS